MRMRQGGTGDHVMDGTWLSKGPDQWTLGGDAELIR